MNVCSNNVLPYLILFVDNITKLCDKNLHKLFNIIAAWFNNKY